MSRDLQGKRVAILVARGFEQVELANPRRALDENGATTLVVSPERSEVRGWNMTEWGESVPVDVPLREARVEDFDALLLPGGVMSPDHLRTNPAAVLLVRRFFEAGKPIAEVAQATRQSPNHIRNLIRAGRLAAVDFGLKGRHYWRVPQSALDDLLRQAHDPQQGT